MATTFKQPKKQPTPKTAGYPQPMPKKTGVKVRGAGAAVKGKTASGPMA